jgi:AcrR family transcriptional regulator
MAGVPQVDALVDGPLVAAPGGARTDDEPVERDTATRLVQAAAEVFAEKGYDKAGVAEIARRAGLTTGAIYSRFTGKAELLAEAIRACGGDEFDELFAQHGFEGRAGDILTTVGVHLVTRTRDPLRSMLLEAFVAARRDPEVQEVVRRHLAARATQMGALIDDAKTHGTVDPALDTAAIVHLAHAVGLGFLLYEAIGAENPSPEAWHDVIARVVAASGPSGPVPDSCPDPDPTPNPSTEEPPE